MGTAVMDTLDHFSGVVVVVGVVLGGIMVFQRRMTGQSWPGLQHARAMATLTFVVWLALSTWLRLKDGRK